MLKKGSILQNGRFPYVVESILGVGGFGITYRVSVKSKVGGVSTTQFFAIKELFVKEWSVRKENSNEVSYPNSIKQRVLDCKGDFIAEARRLSQLRHPNIIKVYEFFEENNTAYYVMEYIEGENLRDYVAAKGEMPVDFMMKLFMPICDAVKTLHKSNMTHLDIKPANIMIRRQAKRITPILIDFGLSKHYDSDGEVTSTVRVQGCSDGYSPIEQYAGISKFSPQTDIYALAATMLYCLTCKRPPIASALSESIIYQLFPSDTPENVKTAIVHAMHQSRGERTKSVNQLLKEFSTGKDEGIRGNNSQNLTSQQMLNHRRIVKEEEDESPKLVNWTLLIIIFIITGGWFIWHNFSSNTSNSNEIEVDKTPGYSTNVPGFQNERIEVVDTVKPKNKGKNKKRYPKKDNIYKRN